MLFIGAITGLREDIMKRRYTTTGAFRHRPRGPNPVEPGLLAEDVRCPPISSWWGLETSVNMVRCSSIKRPSGGYGGGGGGGGAIGGEIVQQPPPHVFLTPPGLRGTRSQECGRSRRKEVCLPRGSRRSCFVGYWSATAVRAGHDRVRRLPRYPRYRTGPTVRHRRGRG